MINLPYSDKLPIHLLATCFSNKSTTYKFYWFISILQYAEEGKMQISKQKLFAQMISNAWYTINYFNISFGIQDKFQKTILFLRDLEDLKITDKKEKVRETLTNSTNQTTIDHLRHFDKNVPHKFLSPWTSSQNRNEVYEFTQDFSHKCPYALYKDYIVINPDWIQYFQLNSRILKDFCYWNLSLYIQARNPNVPDIPNKLIKSPQRGSLTKQRNLFWNLVFEEKGAIKCIYTGEKLTIENYAVEHFIPHSFVSHDLIWNLIPANPSFNSTKSNKLPSLDKYFEPFFNLQREAIEIVFSRKPNGSFLLEYLTIFPNIAHVNELSNVFEKEKFRENIQPLVTIASNNGFQFMI